MINVLFLCTGNTARSILAEAILRKLGSGRFQAFSAGSQPKGVINPLAVEVLENHGYPANNLSSKGWNLFALSGAPQMHIIITVCDNAAGETCPIWPGHPASAHWGVPDPHDKIEFEKAFHILNKRIAALTKLDIEGLDHSKLDQALREIGRLVLEEQAEVG